VARVACIEQRLRQCFAVVALIGVVATASGAGQETSSSSGSKSPGADAGAAKPSVVAWVNASPIYYDDVQRGVEAVSKGKKIDADKLPQLQATVLQDLIDQKVLSSYLKTSQLEPSASEIDAAVDDFSKKLGAQQQTLKQYLEQNQMPEARLRKQIAQELALQKYVAKNTTDDALQQYFHDHRQMFDGTERRVSHILFRPLGAIDEASIRALIFNANQLRGRIVVRELSFESAARKYSDGPSRYHGGDVGFIPRQGVASQQFSEAAFALRPGEISQPVLDGYGVHLIKVTDMKPGQKTWQDARDEVKGAYTRTLLMKLMDDLRTKTNVEFFDAFPHFTPGTRELATPQPVGTLQ
jgi:peptidyl-prolyl cis-trans isomerase SurA